MICTAQRRTASRQSRLARNPIRHGKANHMAHINPTYWKIRAQHKRDGEQFSFSVWVRAVTEGEALEKGKAKLDSEYPGLSGKLFEHEIVARR